MSVTSNEPDNGLGDGDTSNDISGAGLGTDDRSVQVRAERSGTGTGRVYTFVYRVTDSSGNFYGRHRDRDRPARPGALTPGRQGRSGRQGSGATRRLVAPLSV